MLRDAYMAALDASLDLQRELGAKDYAAIARSQILLRKEAISRRIEGGLEAASTRIFGPPRRTWLAGRINDLMGESPSTPQRPGEPDTLDRICMCFVVLTLCCFDGFRVILQIGRASCRERA